MKHLHSLTTLAALAATAAPLAAQGRVWVREDRPRANVTIVQSRRAVIGVTVDLRPSASDSLGASISAVTPGGPAARAGLVAGDVITKFNGTALVERGRRTIEDDGEPRSAPGLKLLDLTARMGPGDTVTVEWRHERARKTARVVAQSAGTMVYSGDTAMRFFTGDLPGGGQAWAFGDNGPEAMARLRATLEGMERMRSPLAVTLDGPDRLMLRMGGPLGGVQFAPINPDLGRYFGTTEGILVLDTPDSSAGLDLKGGDVLLTIDGRKPTSVGNLYRILESYDDGQTFTLDVLRDRRHVSVTATAEAFRGPVRVKVRTLDGPPDGAPVPGTPPRRTRPPRAAPEG
ncbi:MAG TPA: PDZ domain-containing protein [Gemmatimonadales bacterium]|nr:PDZ domain-containing protein [Gemmatimonadales bacterium]